MPCAPCCQIHGNQHAIPANVALFMAKSLYESEIRPNTYRSWWIYHETSNTTMNPATYTIKPDLHSFTIKPDLHSFTAFFMAIVSHCYCDREVAGFMVSACESMAGIAGFMANRWLTHSKCCWFHGNRRLSSKKHSDLNGHQH